MKRTRSMRALAGASIGNFSEIYDFAIFGFSAPILASHFFPGTDRTAALLSIFAVYAVAFFARPIGGLMFGFLADKIGRVKVMATTVLLMSAGTAVIGLLPTYDNIGIAAALLLVCCRIAQGLAIGGETTGSTSYIVESAPDDRRGWWLGLTLVFSHVPNSIVAAFLIGLQVSAGSEAYAHWVWRVPFLMGGIIGLCGFWLRRTLEDPEEFKQAVHKNRGRSPLREALRSGGVRGMLHVSMIQPLYAVGAYLVLGFMYTFLVRVAKLEPTMALLSNGIAVIVLAAGLPLGGYLSDRFGRKTILSIGAALTALAVYPALHLCASGTFSAAVIGQIMLTASLGLYGGASFVAAPEFFPTAFRATGHAISYQVSVAIFGGTSPFIATYLVRAFGTPLAPAYYVGLIAVACLIATQFVPETYGVRLRTSVESAIGEGNEGEPVKSIAHELS
jgi:MFS transporter, MHS family, proline/betaine transporter